MENRFKNIAERCFLTEPVLFAVYCSHPLVPNPKIKCLMRSGKGIVEYQPEGISELPDEALEELLYIEMIRILLKHPYRKIPKTITSQALTFSSDLVLTQQYSFKYHTLFSLGTFETIYKQLLPSNEIFEFYVRIFEEGNPKSQPTNSKFPLKFGKNSQNESDNDLPPPETQSGGTQSNEKSDSLKTIETFDNEQFINGFLEEKETHADLWEEDDEMCQDINQIIESIKD